MTEFPSVTAYLTWDHDRLGALLSEAVVLVSTGNLDAARPKFTAFLEGITRHIRLEEELLFSVFEQRTGLVSGPTQVMRMEHRAIEQAIGRMRAALLENDAAGFAEHHANLIEVLGAHHRREEDILYPMTDRSLPESVRLSLTKKLLAFS